MKIGGCCVRLWDVETDRDVWWGLLCVIPLLIEHDRVFLQLYHCDISVTGATSDDMISAKELFAHFIVICKQSTIDYNVLYISIWLTLCFKEMTTDQCTPLLLLHAVRD